MIFRKRMPLFVMLMLLLCFSACGNAPEPQQSTEPKSDAVNNIYITDDGVYADTTASQNAIHIETTEGVVVAPSVSVTETTQAPQTQPSTQPATEVPVTELTLEQYSAPMILSVITNAINDAKSQQNFSAHLQQQVSINLTDCTLSWAVPVINAAIGVFNGPHDFDYTFVNGSCADPKEDFKTTVTPMAAIPPSTGLFCLEESGVVEARAYEENGEYVYTVVLPAEYTNAQVAVPYYHAQALDYLELNDFDFGIGEITDANCNYPGATVTVRLSPEGKLLKYEETIPMNGSGTGKLGISLSAAFEGSMYECWTFEW